MQVFERDDNGNVVNPPNNPTFESRLTAARDSADPAAIERVQQEYDDWRKGEIDAIEGTTDVPETTDAETAGATPGTEDVPGGGAA